MLSLVGHSMIRSGTFLISKYNITSPPDSLYMLWEPTTHVFLKLNLLVLWIDLSATSKFYRNYQIRNQMKMPRWEVIKPAACLMKLSMLNAFRRNAVDFISMNLTLSLFIAQLKHFFLLLLLFIFQINSSKWTSATKYQQLRWNHWISETDRSSSCLAWFSWW